MEFNRWGTNDYEDEGAETEEISDKLLEVVRGMDFEAIVSDLDNPFAELWEEQIDGSLKFKYADEFIKLAMAMQDNATDYDNPYWWVGHAHELHELSEGLKLGLSEEQIQVMGSIATILSGVDKDGNIPDHEGDLYQQEVVLDEGSFLRFFQAQAMAMLFVEDPTNVRIECRQSFSSGTCGIECAAIAFGTKSCGADMKEKFMQFMGLVDEFYVDAVACNSIKVTFIVHDVFKSADRII